MRAVGLGLVPVVVVVGLVTLLLGVDLGTRMTVVVIGLAAFIVVVGGPVAFFLARGDPERGVRLLGKLDKVLSKL